MKKKSLWNKRIPTVAGFLFIVIAIGITSFLVNTGIITIGRASPAQSPQKIRISNITDTSFTVSYSTAEAISGSISYGKDETFGQVALDERDQQSGTPGSYRVHSITVKTLEPKTEYFFTILSGGTSFLKDTVPFSVTTAPKRTSPPSALPPISGRIITENAEQVEAIVSLSIPGAQTISTIAKPDGSFLLPINTLLTESLTGPFLLAESTKISLLVTTPSQESLVITTIKETNPVPQIILGKQYDFTSSVEPLVVEPAEASRAASLKFPSFTGTESTTEKTPQILVPRKDQRFVDQQPFFRGTAPAGADVEILINVTGTLQTKVKADRTGNWSYRPAQKLAPGSYTLSILTRDQTSTLQTITQTFSIFAVGSQVSETATPSATPRISLTPTPIQSGPTSAQPTPTTSQVIPTITPTLTPAPTVIPPTSVLPSPTQALTKGGEKIPEPGSSSLLFTGIGALITTIIGISLFFLNRGAL